METESFVTGDNDAAPFSLKVHRGEGMVLLGMNWRDGPPPDDFVGFAIQYQTPGSERLNTVGNRIGFPGQIADQDTPRRPTTEAPIQKFRWVHVPSIHIREGRFTYHVTAMHMDASGALTKGATQKASLPLLRETLPGKLNICFTRGYVSSQAFASTWGDNDELSTIVAPFSKDGLEFQPTHPKAKDALEWMGFEARHRIHALLGDAAAAGAEVRAILYDLNLPEILDRLEALGSRLKVIIDDSDHHGDADSPESKAEARLIAAGANVRRQHMSNLQHHKSIAVRAPGLTKVLYGSTNFTWRGFFVQSNNAAIITSVAAVDDFFAAFDAYFATEKGAAAFVASGFSGSWRDLGVDGVTARVGFSPHPKDRGLLDDVASDIDAAQSSLLFSLAFLGQTKRGAVGPALGRALTRGLHCMGVADARVHAENLGVTVLSAEGRRRIVRAEALTGNVPAPFRTEARGLAGLDGTERGTRMHHKFVVLDFDTPQARVYFGSYNFSEPADLKNGENLVCVENRVVATAYMIEAVRIYDHYRFRVAVADGREGGARPLELRLPPAMTGRSAWWERDWDDPVRARDRLLFA